MSWIIGKREVRGRIKVEKLFFQVMSGLKVSDEIYGQMETVSVEKAELLPDQNELRLHLYSDHLIPRQMLYDLEKQIPLQLFPDSDLNVKISDRYRLSDRYTPQQVWENYYESILLELRTQSQLLCNILRHSHVVFRDRNTLTLEMPDDFVTRSRDEQLRSFLDDFFNRRCDFSVNIRVYHCENFEDSINSDDEDKNEEEFMSLPAADQETHREAESQSVGAKRVTERPRYHSRRQVHSDLLWGRDFSDQPVELSEVIGEMGEIVVNGRVIRIDKKELMSGDTILTFDITDLTDSITVKMYVHTDQMKELDQIIQTGACLMVKGVTTIDKYSGELTVSSVRGIRRGDLKQTVREDNAPVKRVELHCHTKMSDMDGVSDVKDIIRQAQAFGHKAIAITDHGNVQAFPDASHAAGASDDFKVIYGVEGYLIDDMQDVVERPAGQTLSQTFVVLDIETTGLSAAKNKIIEIGAVKLENGGITDHFSTFVNPCEPIPADIVKLTSITDAMVADAPTIEAALPAFLDFANDAVIIAHNAHFDMGFMEHAAAALGFIFHNTYLDTMALSRLLLPQLSRYRLDTVARAMGISLEHHHRAVDDAETTAEIFLKFASQLEDQGVHTMEEINELSHMSDDALKKLRSHHVIILAKNDTGRTNLYRLISLSHLKYYARSQPRIPKSALTRYREGLIVGSGCEAGELYEAVVDGASDEELESIVKFYDYLEIQPLGNTEFMLRDPKSAANTKEDLMSYNRRIVQLGEEFGKPVVATGDVHFLNPEDGIYRQILMSGKGFKDTDYQAPLYLRTTEEMLDEFEYLGSDKAYEVVVTNSNLIADMCEKISPVRPDKCPPVIPDSDKTLRDICRRRMHEMYGENPPAIVEDRLEKELNSIISNGFAVMYIIAQKLVWKSNEDGYLVGSRGSVGSSFVATMAGITEVNPLPPHYYCPSCHYTDFDSDLVKSFAGMAGCDMPDRVCPVCGAPLRKDGFDIPFETFLGFKGNKEPDIDLNFSGDYQTKAHKYTEVIFGAGQTFRAGTIGTLADKTAYGYVKNYFEDRNIHKRKCEIDRLTQGCVGVRRTTGQHPGGIMVLPHGEDICSFTPIQHPANDVNSDIITTHFDYHSIDHNLLKLDILGHDDPSMIRMLETLVPGLNAREIPLDSPEVMSLFMNTDALGIRPEDIGGCQLGTLGVPEFGTDLAMQTLIEAKPKYFSDLVRIAGLAHGTDVWGGNAQTLIQNGTATIQTVVCCRDDIMLYLISMGVEASLAFDIMESVRRGRGVRPEWAEEMRGHNVPQWYIDSCNKIQYLFPKAHAAAYVMMAWRIAWCKIHEPLAYYTAFFSIRASGFSYEMMGQGIDRLKYNLADYRRRQDELSQKEQGTLKDMRIAEEMYARGISFMPIDISRASARDFQIIDGKIMPALNTIDGLGDKAAEAIVDAVKDGPFLSIEDFGQRTHVSKTIMDEMDEMGMFGDLPASNQMSLFDLIGGTDE